MSNIAAPSTSTTLKAIDGLTSNETNVKGITLRIDTEYKANINNKCLTVYNSKLDKKNQAVSVSKKEVKDDIQISIKLGKYKGYVENKEGLVNKNTVTYLAFENVKDNSEYLLIKSDDVLSITAEGEPSGPSASDESNPNGSVPLDNSSTDALDGQDKPQIDDTESSIGFDNSNIQNNEAVINPIREDAITTETPFRKSGGGGKRRTAKKAGASKKRVSKKDKKTRKVKRAGRKA